MFNNPILIWTFLVGFTHLCLTVGAIYYVPKKMLEDAVLEQNMKYNEVIGAVDNLHTAYGRAVDKVASVGAIAKGAADKADRLDAKLQDHFDWVAAQRKPKPKGRGR